ncbi:MAG: RagB/SusD family nutrient uptake outer membrane protein [Bacteroidales bacterium]|nr:RagB/SusD family nutrient uptake outer membrane protein [Bacteroidales bacterium]
MSSIHKFLLIIPVLAVFTVLHSCSEDFLMKEPPGAAAGSVMESPDGVESLLVSAYSALKGTSMFGGSMGSDWMYGSAYSDDCHKGGSAGDYANPGDAYDFLKSHTYYVRDRWKECYEGVLRANFALEYLGKNQNGPNPIAGPRALHIEAEAKFLRAWFHFEANKVFEYIPYIKTREELAPVLPENVPNSGRGWDGIEEDLQFAIDNLPAYRPLGEPGRATRYSAEAVKAHAHMHQKEFNKAKVLLDDIINNGGFELVSNFYDNYDMTHENNAESIFEIQAVTTATKHYSVFPAGAAFHQKGPASLGGWGYFNPTQVLFEAFQVTEEGLPVTDIHDRVPLAIDQGLGSREEFIPTDHLLDLRVDWTIARRGIDFLGWGIHPGGDWMREQHINGPYMTKKYMHFKSEQGLNLDGIGFYNGKNYRLYRLAHIILWRAEVAAEEGDLEYARTLVNMIRTRAKESTPVMGLCTSYSDLASNPVVDWTRPAANYKVEPYPSGHPAFSGIEEAREAVRLEIRFEFATEGHRFFDLRRWGIDGEVLNDFISRDTEVTDYMKGARYDPEEDDFWPLPPDEVELQKGILKQDSSYLNFKTLN